MILPAMSQTVLLEIPMSGKLRQFQLPSGVQRRLTDLLDRQDGGAPLTNAERREAEGLVEVAETLSLLKLRAARAADRG